MHDSLDLSNCLDYRGSFASPSYATHKAAGLDLRAELKYPYELRAGERVRIPTGLWLNLPDGVELQVRPRSGLAWLNGITVVNSPGTVEPDYPDELAVLLINHGTEAYTIEPGAKIAQGVLAQFLQAPQGFTDNTKERTGGFGSTGT
jgi:dUTP pyrophosphatase